MFALVVGYGGLLRLGGAVVGVALENLLECYPIDDGLCISFGCSGGSLGVFLGNPAEDFCVHPGELGLERGENELFKFHFAKCCLLFDWVTQI